jgi:ATP-dependent DNA ligase
MLLLPVEALPEGEKWPYEPKHDGYWAVAFKSNGRVHLRSRNDNDFTTKYPAITAALAGLPDETVVDGELIAFDQSGRPSFNALQNHASSTPVVHYLFDVLILAGQNVMGEPLSARRKLLQRRTKRLDSVYEPGLRSGAWLKMPINRGQEFVIGGYTPSPKNFDALSFGYYDGDRLLYVSQDQERLHASLAGTGLQADDEPGD